MNEPTNVPFLHRRWLWLTLLGIYLVACLVAISPALLAPVLTDDSLWMIDKPRWADGSYLQAIQQQFANPFSPLGTQPRISPIHATERTLVTMATMDIATATGIAPHVVWSLLKLSLLALFGLATYGILRTVRYRDTLGDIRGLSRATVVFVMLALPAAIAVGVKAHDIKAMNGWVAFPSLTYGPVTFAVGVICLALVLHRRLQQNFGRWIVPTVLVMGTVAVIINWSYEVLALTIPVTLGALMLDPWSREGSLWRRFRSRFTVGAALVFTYVPFFAFLRYRISQMECIQNDTCYTGTSIDLQARSLLLNLRAGLPFGDRKVTEEAASALDKSFPGPTTFSWALGLLIALLLVVLWTLWVRAHRDDAEPRESGALVQLMLIAAGIGGLAAFITGMTLQWVDLANTAVAYRTGPAIWMSATIGGLALARLLMVRIRIATIPLLAASAIATAVVIAVIFPRNAMSAERLRTQNRPVEFLLHELTVPDVLPRADDRRCDGLVAWFSEEPIAPYQRRINAAYITWEWKYGYPFCSQNLVNEQAPGFGPRS